MIISALSVYLLDNSGKSFSDVIDAYTPKQVDDTTVALSKYYLDIDNNELSEEDKANIELVF